MEGRGSLPGCRWDGWEGLITRIQVGWRGGAHSQAAGGIEGRGSARLQVGWRGGAHSQDAGGIEGRSS